MADDPNKSENSGNSGKPEDQNVSEPENQKEQVSETSDTPKPSDTSGTPSSSESSEPKPAQEKAKVEEPKSTRKSVSANLEKIIEQIEKLSVLELADLVHALEERFQVTATATFGTGQAGAAPTPVEEPQEGKTTFNVILSTSGVNKISVIKAVRELVPTLGLKEAKDLVEAAPKPVLEGVGKEAAEEAKTKLTATGAAVELQ